MQNPLKKMLSKYISRKKKKKKKNVNPLLEFYVENTFQAFTILESFYWKKISSH